MTKYEHLLESTVLLLKKILKFIFPVYKAFNKESMSSLAPLIDRLSWTLKLYSLTLVIPLAASAVHIFCFGILGLETTYGFWGNFYHIWIDYYITGEMLDIAAYKWQLFLFCFAFLFTFTEE